MNKHPINLSGFTLFELIISIIIIGLLASFTAPLILRTAQSEQIAYDQQNLLSAGRTALELIAQDIRNTRINRSTSLSFNGSTLSTIDHAGNTNIIALTSGNITRTENGTLSILAGNTSALSFTGYTINGTTTSIAANTYFIRIDFTLTENGTSQAFTTTVQLRNAQ